jgi:hypothetical protein
MTNSPEKDEGWEGINGGRGFNSQSEGRRGEDAVACGGVCAACVVSARGLYVECDSGGRVTRRARSGAEVRSCVGPVVEWRREGMEARRCGSAEVQRSARPTAAPVERQEGGEVGEEVGKVYPSPNAR